MLSAAKHLYHGQYRPLLALHRAHDLPSKSGAVLTAKKTLTDFLEKIKCPLEIKELFNYYLYYLEE
jgi:hypothetical protein